MGKNIELLNSNKMNLVFKTNKSKIKVRRVLKVNKDQVLFITNSFWNNESERIRTLNISAINEVSLMK